MTPGSVRSVLLKPVVYLLSFLIPRSDERWVFTTDASGRFAENTKYLFVHVDGVHDDIRPVWISSDDETVSRLRANGYEAYRPDSWRGRYAILRSKFVFLSHSLSFWEYTGGATVVQLWHGNALKKLGKDSGGESSLLLRLYQRFVGKDWDEFAVTNSGAPLLPFSSAHGIREPTAMVTGYPRNDVLSGSREGETVGPNAETYDRIEELSEDATVIAYMPTYRQAFGGRDGRVPGEELLNLESLNELLRERDAHFLVKLHPSSSVDIDADRFEYIDVLPDDFDVYPALRNVDALVTDYSSIFFDYLLTDRPLIFYPYDLDEYRSRRGFYFDYDEITPGPTATTPDELYDAIERCLDGEDEYADRREFVRNLFYEHQDGNAAERVCQHVKETYIGGRRRSDE